jgi:hypothetical protein
MTATEASKGGARLDKAPSTRADAAEADGLRESHHDAASTDEKPPLGRGLPQTSKAIGVLLGSTTVLSAIMYYFGWSRAYYFYDYFGVESSLLGLTTTDYLQLSVDGLFVPLAIAACVTLAVLWAWSGLGNWASRHGASASVANGLYIVGGLLLLNGLSGIVVDTPMTTPLAVAPICVGVGAVLIISGGRRRRAGASVTTPEGVAIAEWSVLFAFIGLSLFWVANDYSAAVGQSRAQQLVSQLPSFPDTTLYSEKSLGLARPGIQEIRCRDSRGTYGFRYDGLKLILMSGGQYLLLPTDWSRTDGIAVLLPHTNSIRLEFGPAGSSAERSKMC